MAQNQNDKLHCPMKSKNRLKPPTYLTCIMKKPQLSSEDKKFRKFVITNNTESVEECLKKGVNPNSSDKLMRSPLHLAASRGYKEIVGLLIKYGADPNQKDIVGNTPLHLAACINNIEIVTLLLDAGTDVSSNDQFGRNPLQLAQSKLQLLQRNGPIETVKLRVQLQQIIDLMLSFLRKQENIVDELELIKLNLNDTSDSQLEDQVSKLLNAIENIKI